MDNEPEPDFCVYAVIELTAGIASMKIAQTDGTGYKVLEHLRKRPPEAMLKQCDSDTEAVYDELHALLTGFEHAARDYGAAPPILVISVLEPWNSVLTRIASELNMTVFMPDAQQCADMAVAAACRRIGSETASHAFILPFSAQTRFMTGDGAISQVLPMGVDSGHYDYLMLADELERARRKGMLDTCALMRDCAHASALRLSVPEPGTYGLIVCMDCDTDAVAEGEYTAKQLSRMAGNMARYMRAHGVEPGYGNSRVQPYNIACLGRALNGLLIADEVRAYAGFASARIVKVSALDAVLDVLARNGQIERAGVDAELARRSVEFYARTRGIDPAQAARVRMSASMLSKSLARAFSEDERVDVDELIELASTLLECFSGDGIMRPRDVARLPGLGSRRREQLLAICEACLVRDNEDVYARLTPDNALVKERDEEALFSVDMVENDEFSSTDEDEDDVELELSDKSDTEQPEGENILITELSDETDAEPGNAADENTLQYSEWHVPADTELPSDNRPVIADDAYAAPEAAQPYYALRLQGMANTGMREYAEMFGGDEATDEQPGPVQAEAPRAARDVIGPTLTHARELPLQLRVAAILMLARALSAGGASRLSQMSAKLNERGLVVRASARDGATLEALEFRYRAELIKRVFGIKARLKLDKHGKPPKQRRQGPARHTEHRASKGSN